MAYGVKFRLDFDDVLGNGKRLEILQDSYTGDVKSLVGTGDPVVIKWDADDDIYSPIIGSTCTINLFQTDNTDYDTFFDADEREYKVVVSAAQTVFDIYKDRVQEDGGFVEAKSCIDNIITGYYDTESYFNKRVLDDGGVTESLDCIGEILTVERRNIYTTYWTGWLITDQYTEVMAPNPQPITITAIDGLGSLDAYNPTVRTDEPRIIDKIAEGVNNLGLELDFYVNNDIRQILTKPSGFGSVFYPIEQYENNDSTAALETPDYGLKYDIFDKDYSLFNYKEFIEILLYNMNARIYQSNGKWVITNNSTYSEIRVQDDVQQILQDTSTLPTDIEQRRLNYLKQNVEFTSFRKYDYSTLSQTAYNEQALNKIKTDVVPLDRSLVREKLRPYKKINLEIKETRQLTVKNQSFEYGSEYYTVNTGSISAWDIVKSGIKSYKNTSYSTSSSQPSTIDLSTNIQTQTFLPPTNFLSEINVANPKLKFDYYFDTNNTAQTSSTKAYIWYRVRVTNLSGTFYYNAQNNSWSTSSTTLNKFEIDPEESTDKWINTELTIDVSTASFSGNYFSSINVDFYRTYRGGISNYQALYIDNLSIYQDSTVYRESLNNSSGTFTSFNNLSVSSASIEFNTTTNTLIKDQELPLLLNNQILRYGVGGIPAQPYYVKEADYSGFLNHPLLFQTILKQQLNDFKTSPSRYEGTLYNNNSQPLSMLSKVWVNFGENILQENNSCIMDGLEYNLKRNTYNVVMHTPNQDNQLDVTENFETTVVKRI